MMKWPAGSTAGLGQGLEEGLAGMEKARHSHRETPWYQTALVCLNPLSLHKAIKHFYVIVLSMFI